MRPRFLSIVTSMIACTAIAAGCGGATSGKPFSSSWVNDGGERIASLQKQIARAPAPAATPAAMGTRGTDTIVGVPLTGGAPWTVTHAMDARPVLVGNVVVGTGGGEIFALHAASGELLWTRPASGRLTGAGDDGAKTVVAMTAPTGSGSTLLAVDRDGDVLHQWEHNERLGDPAVVGSFVLVPWRGQYVSVLDLSDGLELGRALLRSQTSHAFAERGGVFFGEAGVTRFDEQIAGASQGNASHVDLPARELPGKPTWFHPGGQPGNLSSSALDTVRLYAAPTADGEMGIDTNRFAATYFQIVLGLDATDGSIRWVRSNDEEWIAGAAYIGGFALCDASGEVHFFDGEAGQRAGESVSLGGAVDTCSVQMATASRPPSEQAMPLATQLREAILLPEARHVTIQKLLLRELATREDEDVTQTLIDIVMAEGTPPMMAEAAELALASRRNGAPAMRAALERRVDFLEGTTSPPPVAALAKALGAMRDEASAPLLAEHLLDPHTPEDALAPLAQALGRVATPATKPQLERFFAHYRCMADTPAVVDAVIAVAETLVRLGSTKSVENAVADDGTTPAVVARLQTLTAG